jgi:CheY-like chemotaxis protein
MRHKGQRVLLVDDDAAVAHFSQQVLIRVGYEVVVTTRGQEALATFQAAPQSFVVLITDYTMPGLSGIELAAACRQVRADLPVILCTGNARSSRPRRPQPRGLMPCWRNLFIRWS